MRAVLQRVTEARVTAEGRKVAEIGPGVLALVGIAAADGEPDVAYIAEKIVGLRIFQDVDGKLNRSLREVGGAALIVSQFTLYGDSRRGRRPSFTEAAAAEQAVSVFDRLCLEVKARGVPVERGIFGASMRVHMVNDGPVTLLLDSFRRF
jgi:D-tyrosyl-tRNA(Tyr) deacylase